MDRFARLEDTPHGQILAEITEGWVENDSYDEEDEHDNPGAWRVILRIKIAPSIGIEVKRMFTDTPNGNKAASWMLEQLDLQKQADEMVEGWENLMKDLSLDDE